MGKARTLLTLVAGAGLTLAGQHFWPNIKKTSTRVKDYFSAPRVLENIYNGDYKDHVKYTLHVLDNNTEEMHGVVEFGDNRLIVQPRVNNYFGSLSTFGEDDANFAIPLFASGREKVTFYAVDKDGNKSNKIEVSTENGELNLVR